MARTPKLDSLSQRQLRQLVIEQARANEAYYRKWPRWCVPTIAIGLCRAVKALRKKEKAHDARSR